jgi:hypothetical protein
MLRVPAARQADIAKDQGAELGLTRFRDCPKADSLQLPDSELLDEP